MSISQEVLDHWADNKVKARAGTLLLDDLGSGDCPYCQIIHKGKGCGDCPVKKETGMGGCLGTPYNGVVSVVVDFSPKIIIIKATDAMYDWLETMMKKQGLI